MSHTPRPWRVVQRRAAGAFTPKNGLTLRHLAVDTGSVVWTPSQVQTGGYTEEHLAQASLIAAAPELLDLLQSYVSAINENHFAKNYVSEAVRRSAKRAIAKAEGGAK